MRKYFPTVMNYRAVRDQRGMVFATVLFVGLLLTFIGLSMANVAIAQLHRTNENVFVSNALLTAEAGIERSLYEVNNSASFTGFTNEEFYDDATQGRATYTTEVTAGTGPNERIVTSIGRAYRNGSNEIEKERRVRVTIVGTSSPGYSVHVGSGGLIINNGTITNSQVYVNGGITMSSSSSAAIGTPSQPLNVFVANQRCPTGANPGATYPQVCASGQPISIPDWGSSRIYGSVCATGQTQVKFPNSPFNNNPPQISGGSGGQGLIAGCTAPPAPIPTYNRAAHIASMTTTANTTAIQYNCSQWWNGGGATGFIRTMPANIRLNGNANWSSSCDLTLTGNVYITGNLTIDGAARIRTANSLGTTRPIILVDGSITVSGGATSIPNSSGTAPHFVTLRASGSCNLATSCSGNDLKTSQNNTVINVSGGASSWPGTVFQAPWAKVAISGSGNMGSAVAETVQLDGGSTITFGTTLASTTDVTWTIRSYQYDYE